MGWVLLTMLPAIGAEVEPGVLTAWAVRVGLATATSEMGGLDSLQDREPIFRPIVLLELGRKIGWAKGGSMGKLASMGAAVALATIFRASFLMAGAAQDAPSAAKGGASAGLSQWIDAEMTLVSGSAKELNPDQLNWGSQQVRQMLRDRPAMAPYVKEGDALWDWAVRQFAGEGSHLEVQWDGFWPKELIGDRDAGTRGNPPDSKIHIHVTALYAGTGSMKDQALLKGKPKEGPMLWYQTIFELFNARKFGRGLKIYQRALKGEVDREGFILEMDMMEQDTRKEAHEFYQSLWTSQCHAQGLPCGDPVLADQLKSNTLNFKTDFLPEDRINEMLTLKEADDHYRVYGVDYDATVRPNIVK